MKRKKPKEFNVSKQCAAWRTIGTVVVKEEIRTRRVDKGKSGQAQKTAVSGGFGGGILSHFIKSSGGSFWGNGVAVVTQLKGNNSGAAD